MSITDELRKAARNTEGANGRCGDLYRGDLEIIADRIDKEHEREVTMARGEAVTKLGSKVAREYVKLPVDADGVPIHVGDVLETDNGKRVKAGLLTANEYGWRINSEEWSPRQLYHRHEPTVEDVLREFQDVVQECCDTEDTITYYADRIREVLRDAQ